MPIPNDMLEVNRMPVRTSMTMFNLNPIMLLVVHLQFPRSWRWFKMRSQRWTAMHLETRSTLVQWLWKSWVRLLKPFLLEPTLEQILSNQGWIQRGCAFFSERLRVANVPLKWLWITITSKPPKKVIFKNPPQNKWHIANHVCSPFLAGKC